MARLHQDLLILQCSSNAVGHRNRPKTSSGLSLLLSDRSRCLPSSGDAFEICTSPARSGYRYGRSEFHAWLCACRMTRVEEGKAAAAKDAAIAKEAGANGDATVAPTTHQVCCTSLDQACCCPLKRWIQNRRVSNQRWPQDVLSALPWPSVRPGCKHSQLPGQFVESSVPSLALGGHALCAVHWCAPPTLPFRILLRKNVSNRVFSFEGWTRRGYG